MLLDAAAELSRCGRPLEHCASCFGCKGLIMRLVAFFSTFARLLWLACDAEMISCRSGKAYLVGRAWLTARRRARFHLRARVAITCRGARGKSHAAAPPGDYAAAPTARSCESIFEAMPRESERLRHFSLFHYDGPASVRRWSREIGRSGQHHSVAPTGRGLQSAVEYRSRSMPPRI